jgi:branched-chain amino acid transport system ATP-binding protein
VSSDREKLLETHALSAYYGQIEALHAIEIDVGEGELVAVLGANGAGKSTLLRSIMGLIATSGSVSFRGQTLPRHNPVFAARCGTKAAAFLDR